MKNFKKSIAGALTIALAMMLAVGLSGCGEKETADVGGSQGEISGDVAGGMVGVANPWKDYSSLEELNEHFYTRLAKPGAMGVSDESFRGMESGNDLMAEYNFTMGGYEYTFRCAPTIMEDISGIYTEGGSLLSEIETEGMASTDEYKGAKWFTVDGQYCLVVKDDGKMDEETFKGIVEELRASVIEPDA